MGPVCVHFNSAPCFGGRKHGLCRCEPQAVNPANARKIGANNPRPSRGLSPGRQHDCPRYRRFPVATGNNGEIVTKYLPADRPLHKAGPYSGGPHFMSIALMMLLFGGLLAVTIEGEDDAPDDPPDSL